MSIPGLYHQRLSPFTELRPYLENYNSHVPAQQQERNYKNTPHAKQEELRFTVYVGDHQWVDSVSMTWLCWWCVLCWVGIGALKIRMLLFPVCIPKQEVESNLGLVDFIELWICLPACVPMLQHVDVHMVIFENVFSFVKASRSRHQPGNSENIFDVAYLLPRDMCGDDLSCSLI